MTHLGNIIKPGDVCAGYDLTCAQFNDEALESYQGLQLPEVILVKKGKSNAPRVPKTNQTSVAQFVLFSFFSLQKVHWPPHVQAQESRR